MFPITQARHYTLLILFLLTSALIAKENKSIFSPNNWVTEQKPGGLVAFNTTSLEIKDSAGCTLWYRKKLTSPIEINYSITVVKDNDKDYRVSDLNCFWMANDSIEDVAPFQSHTPRHGAFPEYDSLYTYYVGYGGNNNTTTRFRRYDGTKTRPLLPENDLREQKHLLIGNHTYHIKLICKDDLTEYWCDGERVFSFIDPKPLKSGWFAFRLLKNHVIVTDFEILEKLKP
jgi:hypothetical protein